MPKYTQTQIDDAMTILSICASAWAPGHYGNVMWISDVAVALDLELDVSVRLACDAYTAYCRLFDRDQSFVALEAYAGAQALLGSGWLPDTE